MDFLHPARVVDQVAEPEPAEAEASVSAVGTVAVPVSELDEDRALVLALAQVADTVVASAEVLVSESDAVRVVERDTVVGKVSERAEESGVG